MDVLAERTRQMGRRQFLGWSLTSTAVAVVAHSPVAAAATDCETTQVFMLDADWGYPRGPHAKTRLVSNASREAAANRIALTDTDAEAMNLHLCSFAPARAVTVRTSELMTLWASFSYTWHNPWADRDVTILDLRHVLADATGARLWADATTSCSTAPATPPRTGSLPTSSIPASASASGHTRAIHARDETASALAATGTDVWPPKVGAGLLAAGISLVALARRRMHAAQPNADGSESMTS